MPLKEENTENKSDIDKVPTGRASVSSFDGNPRITRGFSVSYSSASGDTSPALSGSGSGVSSPVNIGANCNEGMENNNKDNKRVSFSDNTKVINPSPEKTTPSKPSGALKEGGNQYISTEFDCTVVASPTRGGEDDGPLIGALMTGGRVRMPNGQYRWSPFGGKSIGRQ